MKNTVPPAPNPVAAGAPAAAVPARLSAGAADGTCLHDLIRRHAERAPQSLALIAPGRPPLTYGQLWRQITEVIAALNRSGLGRGDHVALALPDGPELAVAAVAAACGAVAVPFDPLTPAPVLAQGFADLQVRGVIVPAGSDAPARRVAAACGVTVLEVRPQRAGAAGCFDLTGPPAPLRGEGGLALPNDAAIVLTTSGTTGEPKWAPWSQAGLCVVAATVAAAYELTPDDRCLDVLPLLYIHGLVHALMASLAAGASTVVPSDFAPQQFFGLLDACRPTWFTATPALHQAILQYAAQRPASAGGSPLRLVRCGGQPVPPEFLAKLEAALGAPVLESYGMTETGILSTNPPPPGTRKAGSVGRPVGPPLGILAPDGTVCPPGVSGEIAVRGGVRAYRSGERAVPAPAVSDGGWFRTGDEGYLDADGYLYVTGRLKEMINRGGEKVPPLEVDRVLQAHPAVELAMTFGVPDPALGETVAAAIVLRPAAQVTGRELRAFAAERLAAFKVPRQIIVLPELPRARNGKVRRRDLAGQLAAHLLPDPSRPIVAPQDGLEQRLAAIWEEVLAVHPISADDDFFELGGQSLSAALLTERIAAELGIALPLESLYHAPTLRQMAALLRDPRPLSDSSPVVAIQPQGPRPPFILCLHPWLEARLALREVVPYLSDDQPVYGIQPACRNAAGQPYTRIEEYAAAYLAAIRTLQPHGPYYLGGYSWGGYTAFEVARQLEAQGEPIAFLGLIDAPFPFGAETLPARGLRLVKTLLRYGPRPFVAFAAEQGKALLAGQLRRLPRLTAGPISAASQEMEAAAVRARRSYTPGPLSGGVTLFRASEYPLAWDMANRLTQRRWQEVAAGGLEVIPVGGHHHSLLSEPHARSFAATLDAALRRAQARAAAIPPAARL